MCKQNHTYAVDYFAVGVIAYEFMIGRVIINFKFRDRMLEDPDKKLEIKS